MITSTTLFPPMLSDLMGYCLLTSCSKAVKSSYVPSACYLTHSFTASPREFQLSPLLLMKLLKSMFLSISAQFLSLPLSESYALQGMTSNVSQTQFLQYMSNSNFIPVPPYGQEQVEEIESIFEISHLRSTALFLDIQCKFSDSLRLNVIVIFSNCQTECLPRLGISFLMLSMMDSSGPTLLILMQMTSVHSLFMSPIVLSNLLGPATV